MPILPTVLVNGAEGIGTGWSTYVPNYNPRDIAENLKVWVQGLLGRVWGGGKAAERPGLAQLVEACPYARAGTPVGVGELPRPHLAARSPPAGACRRALLPPRRSPRPPRTHPHSAAAQRLLNGEPMEVMAPWYRGFRGTIDEVPSKTGGKSYNLAGIVHQVGARGPGAGRAGKVNMPRAGAGLLCLPVFLSPLVAAPHFVDSPCLGTPQPQTGDHSVDITELPVRKWTQVLAAAAGAACLRAAGPRAVTCAPQLAAAAAWLRPQRRP